MKLRKMKKKLRALKNEALQQLDRLGRLRLSIPDTWDAQTAVIKDLCELGVKIHGLNMDIRNRETEKANRARYRGE